MQQPGHTPGLEASYLPPEAEKVLCSESKSVKDGPPGPSSHAHPAYKSYSLTTCLSAFSTEGW